MEASDISPTVQVHNSATGLRTYSVDVPPEALPPVAGRDIERAWYAARQAAIAERWGPPRGFRFRRQGKDPADRWQVLALADADARCWADAVDATVGMASAYGLSLCLRLLALVDLLGRVGWTGRVVRLARDGAELHPALLAAAATIRLTGEAGFDESLFRDHLGADIVAPPSTRLPSHSSTA